MTFSSNIYIYIKKNCTDFERSFSVAVVFLAHILFRSESEIEVGTGNKFTACINENRGLNS